MNSHLQHLIYLVPGLGMLLVAFSAVALWHRVAGVEIRWYWVGAALWSIAVALKIACALLINRGIVGFLQRDFTGPASVIIGGLFLGIESSAFEMGITWLAAIKWRQLGETPARAIGIGIGAGAFEALVLSIVLFFTVLAFLVGGHGTEAVGRNLASAAHVTPLWWLMAPVERVLALLGHASSRALILLGTVNRNTRMVVGGFLIFTLIDGVAGGALLTGKMAAGSKWWIEALILPFALLSVWILEWCYHRKFKENDDESEQLEA